MGLDSYLYGLHSSDEHVPSPIELAYWRSNGDLHVTIVNKFNGGVDDCESFELTQENLIELRADVVNGNDFGAAGRDVFKTWDLWSDDLTGVAQTLGYIDVAIGFLKDSPGRKVFYSASW